MTTLPPPLDRRCWRYRLDENGKLDAMIFEAPELVPDGEGWADSPAALIVKELAKETAKDDGKQPEKSKGGKAGKPVKESAKEAAGDNAL